MHNEPTRKGNRSRKALATAQNANSIKQARPRKAASRKALATAQNAKSIKQARPRKAASRKAPGMAAASAALSIGQGLVKKKY